MRTSFFGETVYQRRLQREKEDKRAETEKRKLERQKNVSEKRKLFETVRVIDRGVANMKERNSARLRQEGHPRPIERSSTREMERKDGEKDNLGGKVSVSTVGAKTKGDLNLKIKPSFLEGEPVKYDKRTNISTFSVSPIKNTKFGMRRVPGDLTRTTPAPSTNLRREAGTRGERGWVE